MRFYLGHELCVDLDTVSMVGYDHAVIGGQLINFSPPIAFDIRKQFRAYKELNDKRSERKEFLFSEFTNSVKWAAMLIGNRLNRSLRGEKNG